MHSFNRSAGSMPANENSFGDEPLGSSRPPLRVLVVEDQVLIALSLVADLCALDCDVVGRAASGERAIDIARETGPDIVFMDVHLGGHIDGIEAAERIQHDVGARIVFITGHADGRDRIRMEALKPAAILGKPYDPADLARIADQVRDGGQRRSDRYESLSR